MSLLLTMGLFACKEGRQVEERPEPASVVGTALAASKIGESCERVCEHRTSCLRVPEYASQCVQIYRDQSQLPEQEKTLLIAHNQIISECSSTPCTKFNSCLRRVIAEEMERVAQELGATATIEITASARQSFKE